MAYSYINYTADGEDVNFSVPFPYLLAAHVKVYVQGLLKTVGVHYTWLNAGVVQFITAPLVSEVVSIVRSSGRDARLVDYVTGSILKEEDLDLDSNQLFYIMQEAFDALTSASGEDSAIFSTPESILDAITGNIETDFLTGDLQNQINYLTQYWLSDAVFEESVYEYGVMGDGTARIDLMDTTIADARIDIDAANAAITLNVADIEAVEGDVSYNAGQISLLSDEFFVKLDSNGNVAGFGLVNGDTSQFVVNADQFAIIKADGTGSSYVPFIVDTESGLVGIDGNLLVTGSITGAKIAADTVEASNIKAATITTAEIAIGGVEGTNIKDGAIATDKLAANAVTAAKITAGTITADELASLSISTAKLQVGSVDDTIIADGAVTTQKVYANAITATHIGTNEIIASSANIKTAVIEGIKIKNADIDSLQIKGNAVTIPASAHTEGEIIINNGGGIQTTVQSVAIQASGSPIFINVAAVLKYYYETVSNINIYIYRGETVIYNTQFTMRDATPIPFSTALVDSPTGGAYTYYFKIYYSTTGAQFYAYNRSLLLLGVKR